MKDGRFQVFAVRLSENSIGRRGLKETQVYYFYQGYNISEDRNTISVSRDCLFHDNIFNDYQLEQSLKASSSKTTPHISISAIVGKNGSGKSTIIEFMIRLINNYSAMLFGEQMSDNNLSHLHYINRVEGELYYYAGDKICRVHVKGRRVEFDVYEEDEDCEEDNDVYRIITPKHLEINDTDNTNPILDVFGEVSQMRPYLEHFFYTVVSNYSIFAYNTLDYQDENNSIDYEQEIIRASSDVVNKDLNASSFQCNWLHGLFHKNDGYKIPLVITPYRDGGNIDINIENTLSRERFISMLLMSYDEDGGYKRINEHLDVECFKISLKSDYGIDYIKDRFGIKFNEKHYMQLQLMILDTISKKLLGEFDNLNNHIEGKRFGRIALNYIVYKSIKITTNYEGYRWVYNRLKGYLSGEVGFMEINSTMFEYMDSLLMDRSHITRKIRQVLAYLLTAEEDDVYKNGVDILSVKELSVKAKNTVGKLINRYGYDFYVRDIEDMMPPAFLDSKIMLKEVNGEGDIIAFETLSSGEKQQVFSVCGLLYHLLNINSVKEDIAHKRYSYNYVNLIMEEIELYFHPDFQKRYITMLIDGIAQLNLNNIYGINLCFVTHSPFILSDIPRSNLLIMNNGKATTSDNLKTFGANIYDMLKSSFFLEGTPIGSYAQWLITRTIITLKVWKHLKNGANITSFDHLMDMMEKQDDKTEIYDFLKGYFNEDSSWNVEDFKQDYSSFKLKETIKMIDEIFVREQLMKEYYKVFIDEIDREKEIAELERRLNTLKKEE